jgi:adenylate cyclase
MSKKLKTRPEEGLAPHNTITANSVLRLIEWLSGEECHGLDEAGLIHGLGHRLCDLGLPIDRLTLHLMTLHPEIVGHTLAWAPNEPVEIHSRNYGAIAPAFMKSALPKAMSNRQTIRARRDDKNRQWQKLDVFAGRELVELMIVPLCNSHGPVSAACFGTRHPGGFSSVELRAIERIVPALRNVCEIRALRQVELSLLDTYVGPMTAKRILAGHIRKGEAERLEAALLLCDLRGFTVLSNSLPGERVLTLLNIYFDAVVPTITAHGGEILKFMGDAVLAVFPACDAEEAAAVALTASEAILRRIDGLAFPDARLEAGIALHHGEVSYGNVGSGCRLDFTVIGPGVNLVSRIQGVCAASGNRLLMSGQFAGLLRPSEVVSVGTKALKGFKTEVELFTPVAA